MTEQGSAYDHAQEATRYLESRWPARPRVGIVLGSGLGEVVSRIEDAATVPYTSINGHMFSYLSKTGTLALRLPEDARELFLKKYKATLCKQYGVVQKEYVEVPDALLKKTSELKEYFALGFAYVGTLKPKPTTRKKRE